MAMDYGQILNLALTLIGKRDQIVGIVQDAVKLYDRVKTVVPEVGSILKGSTSATAHDVKWLQTSLNKLVNAGLTVDGKYGEATQNAVKTFQKANGLTEDGWAGVQTQAAMVDALQG